MTPMSAPPVTSGKNPSWRNPAYVLVVFGVCAAVTIVLPTIVSNLTRPNDTCGSTKAIASADQPLPNGNVPAKLTLQSGEQTTLAFGRTRGIKRLNLLLDSVDASSFTTGAAEGTPVRIQLSDFVRSDFARLPSNLITATADAQGTLVRLTVCVNREKGSNVMDPGRYTGDVVFNDNRVSALSLPITVTISYDRLWVVALPSFVFVLLLASWYVWTLIAGIPMKEVVISKPCMREFSRWLVSVGGVLSCAAGLAAAATVFGAAYLRNPSWGASSWEALALFGGMFSAFVTAATSIARVARPTA